MTILAADAAVVHTTQVSNVSQKTYMRDPEVPLTPIVEEPTVPFSQRYDNTGFLAGNMGGGEHVNFTV